MKNWIMKIVISFLLLISFATFTGAYHSGAEITDGDFEDLTILPWTSFPGSGGIAFQTLGTDHSGFKSLQMDNFGLTNYTIIRQYVSVEPNTTYKISGWLRTNLSSGYCQMDMYYSPILDSAGTKKV